MMGASRLLVRLIVRTRPLWRSSPDEDMTSWVRGGVLERARFTSWLSPGGEVPLFDMTVESKVGGHVHLMHQKTSSTSPMESITINNI